MNKKLSLIVEGDGELTALPNLINRLLQKGFQRYDIVPDYPKNAHTKNNLIKNGGIEDFIGYCVKDKANAILILLDSDKECPIDIASHLHDRIFKLNLHIPVAIVCAKCEYEAWFLANLDALIQNGLLKSDASYDTTKIEEKRDVKGWLSANMPSGKYKEVTDQLKMTRYIEFERTHELSRSFRRLMHAIEELVKAIDNHQIIITPSF